MMELARSERILGRVTPLIGPDIQLQHSKLATKPPAKGMGTFAWHQDFAFFPHTNSDLVAVMVMLDDATPENGCMQMVRGSHKLGLLDHTEDGQFHGRLSGAPPVGRRIAGRKHHAEGGRNQHPSCADPAWISSTCRAGRAANCYRVSSR